MEDPEFSRAYPGAQGAEVVIELSGGRRLSHRLRDLMPASPRQVRERFRAAAAPVLGGAAAELIEATIDSLENQDDAGVLIALAGAH